MSRQQENMQGRLFPVPTIEENTLTYYQQYLFDMAPDLRLEAQKAYDLSKVMLESIRQNVDEIYFRDQRERGLTYTGELDSSSPSPPTFEEKYILIDNKLEHAYIVGVLGGHVVGRCGLTLDDVEGDEI